MAKGPQNPGAGAAGKPSGLSALDPSLQIDFAKRLELARSRMLAEARTAAVKDVDLAVLNAELARLADPKALKFLASLGMRGEIVFAVPSLLRAKPSLIGYYRLLLGFSQKEFYKGWLTAFKPLEIRDSLGKNNDGDLVHLCRALNAAAALLLLGVAEMSVKLVSELQLLTLGPQFRGSKLNTIGQEASQKVLKIIEAFAGTAVVERTATRLTMVNKAGRAVVVEFASDPDIAVIETVNEEARPVLAIEIKGGGDVSNVHNRLGEAEKSHQKARAKGFTECWTLLKAVVNLEKAKVESPSTDRFYALPKIADVSSPDAKSFQEQFKARVGL